MVRIRSRVYEVLTRGLLPSLLSGAMVLLHAQAQATTPPGGNPVPWAAVSIHPSDPARNTHNDGWAGQPNGITAQGASLLKLLSRGYNFGFLPFRADEVDGLPAWAKDARYDVRARVDPDDAESFRKLSGLTAAQSLAAFAARQYTGQMLMAQALLTERFHLKAHYELRPRPVYLLTVSKSGSRLQPTTTAPEDGWMNYSTDGLAAAKGVPTVLVATLLAYPAQRAVVDRTGLSGGSTSSCISRLPTPVSLQRLRPSRTSFLPWGRSLGCGWRAAGPMCRCW